MNRPVILRTIRACMSGRCVRGAVFFLLACLLSFGAVAQAQEMALDAADQGEVERALVERWMRCEDVAPVDRELDALQHVLWEQSVQERASLEDAFKRARRAARLPEVIRIQTGGRYDREQQNRKRLTEDYDDVGAIRKSALENRDTYQDDMYINVNLTAEWRLTQTRWSRDEVALRREQTALLKAQKQRASEAMQRWFALHEARLSWCEATQDREAYLSPREEKTLQTQRQRARLRIWQELSELNALTDGWFLRVLDEITENTPQHNDDDASFASN